MILMDTVDPRQPDNLRIRAELMNEIARLYHESGLSGREMAKRLGTTGPRLSDVLNGRVEKCTVDRLIKMLAAVGRRVCLSVDRADLEL